jgi:hypothetical protein
MIVKLKMSNASQEWKSATLIPIPKTRIESGDDLLATLPPLDELGYALKPKDVE